MSEETVIDAGTESDLKADLALIENEEPELELETEPEPEPEPEKKPQPKIVPEEEPEPEPEMEKEEEVPPETLAPSLNRPSFKEINEKYPKLFKEFPDLRSMYFREQKYSEIFPTVDDAKIAVERLEDLNWVHNTILSGTEEGLTSFLGGIKTNPEALDRIASDFLPSLYKTSQDTYFKITLPVVQNFVAHMYKLGQSQGNENLVNAALVMAQDGFGDQEYATGRKVFELPKKDAVDPERQKFENERRQFYESQLNQSRAEIGGRALTDLKNFVSDGIDPTGVLNDYMKDVIIKEVIREVGNTLQSDKGHVSYMDSLWRNAARNSGVNGLTNEWKSRIYSAYLERAKSLVPAIRSKIRSQVLGTAKKVNQNKQKIGETNTSRRELSPSGKDSTSKSSTPSSRDIDWRKTSDEDFLNDKVTLRK